MIWKTLPFPTLLKVDEGKREVAAIITAPVMDLDGEYCDTDGTWPYYEKGMGPMLAASGGQNSLPLREMHGLSAAGKCIHLEFRTDKSIYGVFKVVDPGAWNKIEEGVYTGVSQGGRIVKRYERDGKRFYIADPTECSLVDRPALPVATFDYISKSGSMQVRKFATGVSSMNADQFLTAARHHDEMHASNNRLSEEHAKAAKLHKTHAEFLRKCAANPDAAPKAAAPEFAKSAFDGGNAQRDPTGGLGKRVSQ